MMQAASGPASAAGARMRRAAAIGAEQQHIEQHLSKTGSINNNNNNNNNNTSDWHNQHLCGNQQQGQMQRRMTHSTNNNTGELLARWPPPSKQISATCDSLTITCRSPQPSRRIRSGNTRQDHQPPQSQPTPRLPRGVSRIPHRVSSSSGGTNELPPAACGRPEQAPGAQVETMLPMTPVSCPMSMSQQQPPVCEAFIMTGQSMLKLSSDASDHVSSTLKQRGKTNHNQAAVATTMVRGSCGGNSHPVANRIESDQPQQQQQKRDESPPPPPHQRTVSMRVARYNQQQEHQHNQADASERCSAATRRRSFSKDAAAASKSIDCSIGNNSNASGDRTDAQQQRYEGAAAAHMSAAAAASGAAKVGAVGGVAAESSGASNSDNKGNGAVVALSSEGAAAPINTAPAACGDSYSCKSKTFTRLLAFDQIILQQQINSTNTNANHNNHTRSQTLCQPQRRKMFGNSSRRLARQGGNKMADGISSNHSNTNAINSDHYKDSETAIEFKRGPLYRKRIFDPRAKPTAKGSRGWRRYNVVLEDLRLIMQPSSSKQAKSSEDSDSKHSSPEQQQTANNRRTNHPIRVKSSQSLLDPDLKHTIKIHHSISKRSTSYTKREYVFHLRLADQSEYLLQATSEHDMNSWIDAINFATACLSSPSLPKAISNNNSNGSLKNGNNSNSSNSSNSGNNTLKRKMLQDRLNRRAILNPVYTRLSYWEQLIDHEEHLKHLNTELNNHLNEATNTCNANKRSKTEFIERIAYLKQEIERYTIYVDLMRRKSNSPEAIILSKHPQIASLTPSNEMIKSIPLSSDTSPK